MARCLCFPKFHMLEILTSIVVVLGGGAGEVIRSRGWSSPSEWDFALVIETPECSLVPSVIGVHSKQELTKHRMYWCLILGHFFFRIS